MLPELAFRIAARGAYASQFAALRKDVASLDAGMSTIARTATIARLSIGALAGGFAGGLGARGIVAAWRLVTTSVREAASGATDFGGRVTSEMIPRLNAAAHAFEGIENAVGGLIARAAAGLVQLGEKIGLVDATVARLEAKYGRIGENSAAGLKELQGALEEKAQRDALTVNKFGRFEPPDSLGVLQQGLAARAVEQAKAIEAAQARIRAAAEGKSGVELKAIEASIAANQAHAKSIDTVTSALDDEIAKLGMSAEQQRIYDELQQAGVSITSAAGQAIAAKVRTIQAYNDALEETRGAMQGFQSAAGGFLSTFASGLAQNKSAAESFRDAWLNVLNSLIGKFSEMASAALATQLFGGAGAVGGFGNLIGGIGKLLGFDTGGRFAVGGSGGPDSQLVSMALSPGEIVSVDRADRGDRRAAPVEIAVRVEASPYFDARVRQVSGPVAQQAAVGVVGAYDKAGRRGRELAG